MKVIENELPEEWMRNYDLLFHGTSNCYEDMIDNEGFIVREVARMEFIITVLTDILKNELHGFYETSIVGLSAFEGECEVHKCRPLTFALNPLKCFRYAAKECAGGELLSEVYNVAKYLRRLCADDGARINWQNQYQKKNSKTLSLTVLNASQILEKLRAIEHELEEIEALIKTHTYGLIYVVNFSNMPSTQLGSAPGGDIYSFQGVPRDVIIGKIKITEDFIIDTKLNQKHFFSRSYYWDDKNLA